MQVLVRDNNVDQALKALKKKMQREGIFREMKLRGHYEKPSEKKARERAEAIRRARKLARKRLQREGLLPMKPKVVPGCRTGRPRRAAPAELLIRLSDSEILIERGPSRSALCYLNGSLSNFSATNFARAVSTAPNDPKFSCPPPARRTKRLGDVISL